MTATARRQKDHSAFFSVATVSRSSSAAASRHRSHGVGDRVVGWASGFDGLMEYVVADGDGLAPYDQALSAEHAVALQPLACVLYALEQLPNLKGRHVAVIGQGSIGLLFSYAAKALGARHVTGVDPVDRERSARSSGSTRSCAPPATGG